MKKNIKITAASIVIAIIIAMLFLPSNKYNPKNEGRNLPIRWENVNVREQPSVKAPIIETLTEDMNVELTGHSREFLSDPEELSSWTEIKLPNGKSGWIVTQSIAW